MEIWKKINNYSYEISNKGNVRRIHKKGTYYILKSYFDKTTGYCHINLSKNGVVKHRSVHSLVLETFTGKRPKKHVANHKDCNKTNNNISNLEWITKSGNFIHAIENGKAKVLPPMVGEQHARAKLSEKDVLEIRRLHKENKLDYKQLASMFSVSDFTISDIIKKRSWKHI